MIRVAAVLLVGALAAVAAAAMVGQPGTAQIVWLGWEVRTTAAVAVLLVVLAALLAVVLWRIVLFIAEAPRRAARDRAESRRRQGAETLARGFLAAAAGDGSEARRLAQKAALQVDEAPALVRILAAQAAEAAGDPVAAQAAYSAMLGFPEMRLAGHRGLMQAALAQGDQATALRHAEAAFNLSRSAHWAWLTLLNDRIAVANWHGALELIDTAQARKIASPVSARRARAALLAASAASLEGSADPAERARALEDACRSARLQPDFAPGVVMAARLLAAAGKTGRASAFVARAWKSSPHPALWLAYRDLEPAETPAARAARLRRLAGRNPEHRESLILMVEQALVVRDLAAAREHARRLDHTAPTTRECGLMARLAQLAGEPDDARAWITRGRAAPSDPDWSDLDPEGRAFAYTSADWARMVQTYAQTGELIHPRHERRERVMTELPEAPPGYQPSRPYIAAAATALAPAPDDPGVDPTEPLGAPVERRTRPRRPKP